MRYRTNSAYFIITIVMLIVPHLNHLPTRSAGRGRRRGARGARGAHGAHGAHGVTFGTKFLSKRIEVTVVGVAFLGGLGCQMPGTSATNILGLALEAVVALFTAAQDTTLGLELIKANGGKNRSLMMLRSVVMRLMDGHSGVNNRRLDDLLLNHRLDGLMYVLVFCQ